MGALGQDEHVAFVSEWLLLAPWQTLLGDRHLP